MNVKQITYCLELSHTLNFSRAAENLFISQPSLSYQIQLLEEEIGFRIFDRIGRGGVTLTPAGAQFCVGLRQIQTELKLLVEDGQNMSSRYRDSLNVCLPMRSCIYYLSEIIEQFERKIPDVALNLKFLYDDSRVDVFLRREQDILFTRESEMKRFSDVGLAHIYDSHLYVILRQDDPLAGREIITQGDLAGRRLMIGGGSPPELVAVQNRIIQSGLVEVFNSPDHETSLTNVKARKGVVIAPSLANDHNGEFAWVPYDCSEYIPCAFAYHKDDTRACVKEFITLTRTMFANANNIML